MTDLTEQLYAGTLPTGHYYFNNGVETYIVLYKNINSKHLILQEPSGLTVISEVPSCEEWKQFKEYERIVTSYNMKPIDYETACETVNKLLDEKKVFKEENTKLKELLKECKALLSCLQIDDYDNNGLLILNKINQALGEDK